MFSEVDIKSDSCWLKQHKDERGKSHVCCLVMYVEDKYTDRWVEKSGLVIKSGQKNRWKGERESPTAQSFHAAVVKWNEKAHADGWSWR